MIGTTNPIRVTRFASIASAVLMAFGLLLIQIPEAEGLSRSLLIFSERRLLIQS